MPWKCSRLIQLKPCTRLQCIPGFISATSRFTLLLPRASRDPKTITVEECGGTRILSKSHLCSSTATGMKFISALALLTSPLVIIVMRVSYCPVYDNGRQSLATVACSDGKKWFADQGLQNLPRPAVVPKNWSVLHDRWLEFPNCGSSLPY